MFMLVDIQLTSDEYKTYGAIRLSRAGTSIGLGGITSLGWVESSGEGLEEGATIRGDSADETTGSASEAADNVTCTAGEIGCVAGEAANQTTRGRSTRGSGLRSGLSDGGIGTSTAGGTSNGGDG